MSEFLSPVELILYKISKIVQQANSNFSWLPREARTAIVKVLFSWVFAEMQGKVLKPYKALRIQRSSQLGVPKTTVASTRKAMGALAPGCWHGHPGATSGTDVVLVPRAHLSSHPGNQFGSSWVICALSHFVGFREWVPQQLFNT